MEKEFYIKSRIAQLKARLDYLTKHEKVYPLLIAKVRRELENEKKRLEEVK